MQTVVGLFWQRSDAENAVHLLHEHGFERENISVAARDTATTEQVVGAHNEAVVESAGAGAVGGTAVGGLAGLLLGVGALAIPGIGPIVATGTLLSVFGATAAGAGVGAAAGGLVGALVGWGIPEEDAHLYVEGLRRGGVLVSVHTDDARAVEALDVLQRANAADIEAERNVLREAGSQHFDEQTLPDDADPFIGR